MAKNIIVANWKSHKSVADIQSYFEAFNQNKDQTVTNTEVVICPSFIALESAKQVSGNAPFSVKIGAQNISSFPEGAYTGEVAASQIKDLVEYVIIGHSERRNNFHEDESIIEQKVREAKKENLKVILCVQGKDTLVYDGVDVIAYEPISAIGTGNPASPENVQEVLQSLHEKAPEATLLYGGSVDENSIHSFTQIPLVHGFLVGGASLDPRAFLNLIAACETRNSY